MKCRVVGAVVVASAERSQYPLHSCLPAECCASVRVPATKPCLQAQFPAVEDREVRRDYLSWSQCYASVRVRETTLCPLERDRAVEELDSSQSLPDSEPRPYRASARARVTKPCPAELHRAVEQFASCLRLLPHRLRRASARAQATRPSRPWARREAEGLRSAALLLDQICGKQ